jgi:hypothetical protein
MSLRTIVKSKNTWIGVIAGTVAGGWALRKLGVSVPVAGGRG